jgi:feruloyl esterase
LSAEQAETVQQIYAGPATRTGRSIYPGASRGSELGWADRIGPEPPALAIETYRYLVYADASWDYTKFDVERDTAYAVATIGPVMNSTDPNLAPFFAHGGKLLLYHGWNDPGVPPLGTVNYYENVVAAVGQSKAATSVRLFMVPGMNHCRGGVGTDEFEPVAPLDAWVTRKTAPESIVAARREAGAVVRTRPLCPFPQVAVYSGAGNSDDAGSFRCATR